TVTGMLSWCRGIRPPHPSMCSFARRRLLFVMNILLPLDDEGLQEVCKEAGHQLAPPGCGRISCVLLEITMAVSSELLDTVDDIATVVVEGEGHHHIEHAGDKPRGGSGAAFAD